jgi:hypothetical protein
VTDTSWLPPFVNFDGDWNHLSAYVQKVYAHFHADFVAQKPPTLGTTRVSLRRIPEFEGKSFTFWHLITEGKTEDDRYPVIPRCERIRWPRAVLERVANDWKRLPVWKNRRGTDQRLLIALPEFDYVVVLQEREDKAEGRRFFLLLTAYPVEQAHQREKLRREHAAWAAANTKG